MIFVTVGTQMPFDRLIAKMDEIACRTDEEVIMQIGQSTYVPLHAKHFKLIDSDGIKKLNSNARIVVSHAGIGSILTALEHRKPVLVVPRRAELGEAWDDHQLDIAVAIANNKNVEVVSDLSDLENRLKADYRYISPGNKSVLIESLKTYLNSM